MDVKTIAQLVVQGGFGVALLLVLFGMYRLARENIPGVMSFLKDTTIKQAVTDTKVDALVKSAADMTAAITKQGELFQAALQRAADTTSGAIGKLGDALQEEGKETRLAIVEVERRITAAVHREQADNPPPSTSRPASRVG